MNTTKADRLFDCGPLTPEGKIAVSHLRDQLDTEKAEHIVKDNLLKQVYAEGIDQTQRIINLQIALEAEQREGRALYDRFLCLRRYHLDLYLENAELRREVESHRHPRRTTMLGALLAALLLLVAGVTGSITAVPKNPPVAPPTVSECHTDSECEGLPVMEWGDI